MKKHLSTLLLLICCYWGSTQELANQMVDSLNLSESPEKKVGLCISIAEDLKDSNWDRALAYMELAEKEASKAENRTKYLATVYTAMGRLYTSKGVLDVGVDYYLKGLDLFKEAKDEIEAAKAENNIAIIYAELNNQEKALEYFYKVYAFQKKNKDTLRLAQILNNMGTFFLKRNLDSSTYYFKKSLVFSQAIQDSTLYIYNFTNLGRVYALKNKDSLATVYFNRAKSVITQKTNQPAQNFINYSLADFFSKTKQPDSAIYYSKKNLESLNDNLYNFTGLNTLDIIYKNHIILENYKQAAQYFQLFNTVRDSLNIEEQAVNIERLKLQEEFKSKTQISQLKQEKQQSKYLIVGLTLLACILALSLILIRFKTRIQKNRLEKELLLAKQLELRQNLESKNKALVGKAMNEIHRTDIINGILTDLKKIKRSAIKKETQQAIDYILKRLQLDLNTDIWKEFEVSFEQVHKSFYKNLQEKHPNLTPRDRRLCAMLYLDLTSKEISQLTGQHFKSIENARTRLRKKLNLTNMKENISTYLNTLA